MFLIDKIVYKDGAILTFSGKDALETFSTSGFSDDEYGKIVTDLEDSLRKRGWKRKDSTWKAGTPIESPVPDILSANVNTPKKNSIEVTESGEKRITQETLRDALAYVAITGQIRSLHKRTIHFLQPYVSISDCHADTDDEDRFHLNEEGMIIASTSRMYKAHIFLTEEKGYTFFKATTLAKLFYRNESEGKVQRAHTGWRGKVFINYKEVAQFRSGV